MLKGRQTEVRALIDQAQGAVREAEALLRQVEKKAAARRTVEIARTYLLEAKQNLAFILLDGSLGFHNYERTKDLLQKASSRAGEARTSLRRFHPGS